MENCLEKKRRGRPRKYTNNELEIKPTKRSKSQSKSKYMTPLKDQDGNEIKPKVGRPLKYKKEEDRHEFRKTYKREYQAKNLTEYMRNYMREYARRKAMLKRQLAETNPPI